MDHARGRRAAAGAEVVALDQENAQALERQLAIDADPVDAAADDENVEGAVAADLVEEVGSLLRPAGAGRFRYGERDGSKG